MRSGKEPSGVAKTLEDIEAQEEAIDAWAEHLDAAAWDAYWASEEAEELDVLEPRSFARISDLPRTAAAMGSESVNLDVNFQIHPGDPASLTARISAPRSFWWFMLVLGRGAAVRIPEQFVRADGTIRARRWGSRSAPPILLGAGKGGVLLAFCAGENFLEDRVATDGLVEILKAAARRVVLIRKEIREPP